LGLLRSDPETVPTTKLETSLAIVELLAQTGTDINLADHFGSTPLHDAVRTGRLEAVQKLVQLGANVNIRANGKQDYWRASDGEPLALSKSSAVRIVPYDTYMSQVLMAILRSLWPVERTNGTWHLLSIMQEQCYQRVWIYDHP